MWLIVGLGNPGKRFATTLHNAGFLACDRFAQRNRLGSEVHKFQGTFRRGRVGDHDVGVLKPETYMNLSGSAVAEALRYLPVEITDLIAVFDDMDIPAGRLRLRKNGGHGGHNGMRSLIEHLGSSEFPRIRVGIGRPEGERDATGHVLARPGPDQARIFEQTLERAADALESILKDGIDVAMNRFNAAPEDRGGVAGG